MAESPDCTEVAMAAVTASSFKSSFLSKFSGVLSKDVNDEGAQDAGMILGCCCIGT